MVVYTVKTGVKFLQFNETIEFNITIIVTNQRSVRME